jgi:hypothetical protein
MRAVGYAVEIMYGRRKMTPWLRRNGFPEASKHAVDRLMREEGMNGGHQGPPDPRHHPGQGRPPRRRPAEQELHRRGPEQVLGH